MKSHSKGYATGRFVTNNLHWCTPCTSFGRPTTIDNKRRASHKGCFVGGKIERSICNLIRSPHTSNRLARVKLLAHLVLMPRKVSCEIALYEWSMHCAGTDGVAANALCDEINGYRAC